MTRAELAAVFWWCLLRWVVAGCVLFGPGYAVALG